MAEIPNARVLKDLCVGYFDLEREQEEKKSLSCQGSGFCMQDASNHFLPQFVTSTGSVRFYLNKELFNKDKSPGFPRLVLRKNTARKIRYCLSLKTFVFRALGPI